MRGNKGEKNCVLTYARNESKGLVKEGNSRWKEIALKKISKENVRVCLKDGLKIVVDDAVENL